MYKEIIIIIVVISLVTVLDVVTNNYTKASVEELSYKLNELRMDILKYEKESAKSKMQHIKENWEEIKEQKIDFFMFRFYLARNYAFYFALFASIGAIL